MTYDQNKKTLRNFQCRDYLWEIFEQMSAELECSTDYLINEAMRQYARSRNYGTRTPSPGIPRAPGAPRSEPPVAAAAAGSIPSIQRPPGSRPVIPSAPPPAPYRPNSPVYSPNAYGAGPPPQQGYSPIPGPLPPPPSYPPQGYAPPPAASRPPGAIPSSAPPGPTQRPPAGGPFGLPPPLPGSRAPGPAMHTGGLPQVFVIFNGQKIPVSKGEFVIGRGSKTADLPIKDGNISRRHAAIVFQNGGWYMKDLGSTNGVEFHGQRIDAKRIDEGDVFQLCDYELRFTYR